MLEALAGFPAGVPTVVDDRGGISAPDFLAAVAKDSHWLAASGAGRVALLAGNGRAWAIADLALLSSGRVAVPLPHHFSDRQLRHAVDSAGVSAVLTDDPARLQRLGLGFSPAGLSRGSCLQWLTRKLAGDAPPLPSATAKITYTSGSTAEPKGLCLTRATLETVAGSVADVGRSLGIRRHLSLLPLATLLENVAGMYAAWMSSASCHLHAEVPTAIGAGTVAPARLLDSIGRHQPDSLILVPELLRILVSGAEARWQAPPGAKFFAVGGACVSRELLERAAAAGLPVFEGYGLSECGSVQCLNTPAANRLGSVGRPLPHARVRIDARGEIHVGGTVMAGYVGQAETAAGAEIATGDLGEMDQDGFIYVQGRIKNVFINSFGRNISPEWIERELTQEAAIGQAIACGEARPWVVALVTPSHPNVPHADLETAVERANARLPDYARVARFAVPAEPFSVGNGQLTGNGRPRRDRIQERHGHLLDQLYAQALAS
jgi:long-subunit acyl-CoA synthetase (AMP-forming)